MVADIENGDRGLFLKVILSNVSCLRWLTQIRRARKTRMAALGEEVQTPSKATLLSAMIAASITWSGGAFAQRQYQAKGQTIGCATARATAALSGSDFVDQTRTGSRSS